MQRYALVLLCSLLLGARVSTAMPTIEQQPSAHSVVRIDDMSIFEVMAGDIAKHREQADLAYEFYTRAALRLSDSTIARFAWEAATASRNTEHMLDASRLWLEFDHAAEPAFQTLLLSLIEQQNLEEAKRLLQKNVPWFDQENTIGSWLITTSQLARKLPENQAATTFDLLEPWAKRYEKRSDVVLALAQLERASGKPADACRRATEATRQSQASANTIIEAADICWSSDRKVAIRLLRDYLKVRPKSPEVHIVLAQALLRSGDHDGALREADQAVQNATNSSHFLLNAAQIAAAINKADKIEEWLDEYVRRTRAENPEADLSQQEFWLLLGDTALSRKEFDVAISRYRELTNGPYAVQARLRESAALADSGNAQEALSVLRKARILSRLDAPILFSAEASLLMEQKRPAEALAVMTEALKHYPTEPEILYEAAMVAQENQNIELAETYLETLLSFHPDHVQGNNALGYLWVEQNHRLKEARSLLEKAYRAEPLNPYILDSMGWLCYREGRLRAAREFVSASLKKNYDAEVAAHLVMILHRQGLENEAKDALNELIRHEGHSRTVEKLLKELGELP